MAKAENDAAARLQQLKDDVGAGRFEIGNEAFHKGVGSVVAKSYRRHEAELHPDGEQGVLIIQWSRDGLGFGELTITTRDGKLVLDTECMKLSTVADIMLQALAEAVIAG